MSDNLLDTVNEASLNTLGAFLATVTPEALAASWGRAMSDTHVAYMSPRGIYAMTVVQPTVDAQMPIADAPARHAMKSRKWLRRRNKPYYNYLAARDRLFKALMGEWEKRREEEGRLYGQSPIMRLLEEMLVWGPSPNVEFNGIYKQVKEVADCD